MNKRDVSKRLDSRNYNSKTYSTLKLIINLLFSTKPENTPTNLLHSQ